MPFSLKTFALWLTALTRRRWGPGGSSTVKRPSASVSASVTPPSSKVTCASGTCSRVPLVSTWPCSVTVVFATPASVVSASTGASKR